MPVTPSTSTGSASALDPSAGLRCSDYARATALSPVATSGRYDGFLLVEVPLPWPRDVGDTPEGAALGPLIGPLRYRLQAVVPVEPEADRRSRRVILHARPPGESGFGGYRRFERPVGDSLTETAAALIEAATGDGASPELPGASSLSASDAVDVLVCTHGTRDSCCGRRGAVLAAELAAAGLGARANLWRTSHLGGHRFAPTFMVLPQGTVWGFADVDLVTRVVDQAGDVAGAAARYRGCPGLDGPQVQALEAEVLGRVGWPLLRSHRTGSFDGTTARLSWQEDGQTVAWTGQVSPGRTLPAPACLEAISATGKSETEWTVSALQRR